MNDSLREQLQTSLGTAFTLERELGGGGMSRVFVARERRLNREVVVKLLSPELAQGISAERFEREIQLAASLQQANIVPVLSAGEAEGLPYFTMPFVQGLSLRQRLERGPLPIPDALSILRDVARALAYAHARGVVHRDIKPDNVLLSGETAVVTDFGIAKAISASRTLAPGTGLTQVGTAIGTPAYMAPEQAAGDPATDHRADVYAFGCLAFELLAGRPPFHGLPPHRMLAAHMGEPPAPIASLRPDTPPELATLVERCLAKEPADRPQGAGELLAARDMAMTSGAGHATPGAAAGASRLSLGAALARWALASAAVGIVARASLIAFGLPDWVLPGALLVMALGLPAVLLTWYAQRVERRAALTTPQRTPGGTVAAAPVGLTGTLALRAAPHMSWRRTTRGGVVALGVFTAVVAGFMALRAYGIGPAGSLFAAGKLDDQAKLLVAEFSASGGDSTLGRVVAEAVRTNLGEARVVRVVQTSEANEALGRMRREPGSRLDLATAREMAQREGYAAIVTGDVASLGGAYLLTVTLVDAGSGDELAAAREGASDASELIEAIDRATRTLRGRMGESLRTVRASQPLARATTASLEALRAYTIGSEANGRGDGATAVAQLERAIALDSNFAGAYSLLAISLRNQGAHLRRADSLLARAFELRDRLPLRERLAVTASYHRAGGGYDRAKALVAAESLLALDSTSAPAWNSVMVLRRSRGEWAAVEHAARQTVRYKPESPLYNATLVYALVAQHKWREADSVIAAMRREGRDHPGTRPAEAQAAYLRGRLDSAALIARELAASSLPEHVVHGQQLLATLETLAGRPRAALRMAAQRRALERQRGNTDPVVFDSLNHTFYDIWYYGDAALARRRIANALQVQPLEQLPANERPYIGIAGQLALAGETAEARRWLARYDAEVTDPELRRQQGQGRAQTEAFIAVNERCWDDALRHADAVSRDADGGPMGSEAYPPFMRGFVLAAAGRTDEAITSLEAYLTTPDYYRIALDGLFLAWTYERLGALHEEKGNTAKALEYYGRMVELWRDAEPELQPRVAEIRARMDRLLQSTG